MASLVQMSHADITTYESYTLSALNVLNQCVVVGQN